ncbi:MAG: alpha-L-fucosidase, partial [Eubacteriales bacterium]
MDVKDLVKVTPSARQLAYQQLEFYAFTHITVNTFTDREWGDGTEPESVFNPTALDCEQWVRAIADAGMRGIIITCKHHDGFCLWQSKVTEHCMKNSPYKNGSGDIVREMSDACRKYGMKFGVYLSPWDRNASCYGDSEKYNDFYVAQLRELLTNYGEVFSVWFDGACGEGPNGKRQIYDWNRYYSVIRELQPNACIAICGPDVRWCGNEAGAARESEWSVVPARMTNTEKVAEASQKDEFDTAHLREVSASTADLGSREIVAGEPAMIWYPAEVDTSIRPGWFYHASEDDKVRSFDTLIDIYYNTVGGNAMLLLNIPPDRRGLIHENDAARLHEVGEYLRSTFAHNLAETAKFTASCDDGVHKIDNVRRDETLTLDYENYYKAPDGCENADIEIDMGGVKNVSHVVLKENIALSQRIEQFAIDVMENGEWKE